MWRRWFKDATRGVGLSKPLRLEDEMKKAASYAGSDGDAPTAEQIESFSEACTLDPTGDPGPAYLYLYWSISIYLLVDAYCRDGLRARAGR